MARYSFFASALIPAPAERVYRIISDYNQLHPLILPKPAFKALKVEQGGVGSGTVFWCEMLLMGTSQQFRATVSEPQPGSRLVETIENGTVTTFAVEPRNDGNDAFVTITTETSVRGGLLGRLEGWMTRNMLYPIYVKELEQLAVVAKSLKN
jgi:hypothetical protein